MNFAFIEEYKGIRISIDNTVKRDSYLATVRHPIIKDAYLKGSTVDILKRKIDREILKWKKL
jgi:hypothetical protein